MYLEALKIFCDVVRHKSFSRAAAANRITQSAASQNVLQLEKSLGVKLLDRSKRPLQLTPEGQVYFDGCRGLVERYYAVEAEVMRLSQEVAGTVSVAAIYSVGLSDMSRLVRKFAQAYPQANVRLAYLHPDKVYESVVNEEVDIGLVSFPRLRRGLISLAWRDERMVVVCSTSHRFAQRSELTPSDLSGERMVVFDSGLTVRKEIDRFLRQEQVDVEVGMGFDNIETIKHAVESGEGFAILPEATVAKELRARLLVAVPLVAPGLVRPLGILCRKSGQLSLTAHKFIELIRQNGNDPRTDQAGGSGERSEARADKTAEGSQLKEKV